MVSTIPSTLSSGFNRRFTISIVRITWEIPSSAKNSACNGTSTASAATSAFKVSRPSPGGQSMNTVSAEVLPRNASRSRNSRRSAVANSRSTPERSATAGTTLRFGTSVARVTSSSAISPAISA